MEYSAALKEFDWIPLQQEEEQNVSVFGPEKQTENFPCERVN